MVLCYFPPDLATQGLVINRPTYTTTDSINRCPMSLHWFLLACCFGRT